MCDRSEIEENLTPTDILEASSSIAYCFFRRYLERYMINVVKIILPTWKKHRKILNPAFNQQVLGGFMGIFNDQARKLVKDISSNSGLGPFEIDRHLALNNLEIICRSAFGANPEENCDLITDYVHALEKILNILLERFQKPWLHSDFVYKWTSLKKNETKVVKILHKLTNAILQTRKEQLSQKIRRNSRDNFKAFMDQILEMSSHNKVYKESEVRDEVDTIIFGGHDTASTALIYILILIGSYPNVQEKVYNEIIKTLGTTDGDVNKKDLSKLVYMEAVIKETLRLYPIGPIVARYATEEVKLKNYTVPPGSSCFLFFWGLHHHLVWGSDAEQFKPERWLHSDTLPKNPNAFGAFSIGKRSCIGRVYAMMSIKTTLAHVLRHYRIASDVTKLVLKMDTFLKPSSGHFISIEKR